MKKALVKEIRHGRLLVSFFPGHRASLCVFLFGPNFACLDVAAGHIRLLLFWVPASGGWTQIHQT